jgi:hypothetical protein
MGVLEESTASIFRVNFYQDYKASITPQKTEFFVMKLGVSLSKFGDETSQPPPPP